MFVRADNRLCRSEVWVCFFFCKLYENKTSHYWRMNWSQAKILILWQHPPVRPQRNYVCRCFSFCCIASSHRRHSVSEVISDWPRGHLRRGGTRSGALKEACFSKWYVAPNIGPASSRTAHELRKSYIIIYLTENHCFTSVWNPRMRRFNCHYENIMKFHRNWRLKK